MTRRVVIEGDETALRVRVSDRRAARAQLDRILEQSEQEHIAVRVIPIDQDGFGGSGVSMMYADGPVPQLDTCLRDVPTGVAFIDAQAQLTQLRALFLRLEKASLDPTTSRDFIHRMTKEL